MAVPGAGPGARQEQSRLWMQLVWHSRATLGSALQGLPMDPPWHQQLIPAVCAVPVAPSRCSGSRRKQKANSDAVRAGRKLWLQEGISRTL